ncbi:MAG: energy-coupling factor transporter transmembrane protein EcfT [Clostridiales Family XIII bacterium]|jgi:energy-coupling factor transport system permease protein|nr:energy-coupling factor transporter transmembrane protein EcfT [Clostridiales Family XIII bacterium]
MSAGVGAGGSAGKRGLRALDPRPKLLLMATVSTLCMLTEGMVFLFAEVAALLVLLAVGRADFALLWRRCRTLVALIASLFVIQALFAAPGSYGTGLGGGAGGGAGAAETAGAAAMADPALINIGNISLVHISGLFLAAMLALRLIIIVVSAQILLEGEVRDYMLAFTQMRLPYELAFMVVMGLHFLPILRDEAMSTYYCMQLRGVAFRKTSLPKKLKAYAGLCLPVLVSTLRRADETSTAMELRGFRAMGGRTYMRKLVMNRADVAALVLLPAVFVTLFILLR